MRVRARWPCVHRHLLHARHTPLPAARRPKEAALTLATSALPIAALCAVFAHARPNLALAAERGSRCSALQSVAVQRRDNEEPHPTHCMEGGGGLLFPVLFHESCWSMGLTVGGGGRLTNAGGGCKGGLGDGGFGDGGLGEGGLGEGGLREGGSGDGGLGEGGGLGTGSGEGGGRATGSGTGEGGGRLGTTTGAGAAWHTTFAGQSHQPFCSLNCKPPARRASMV